MATTNKIASLEFSRVIAMFAIVGLHCQMALTYWQWDGVPWVGYMLNQLARFAVPLFFLISGFLIQPKLSVNPIETLKNYAKPLLKIWLVWSAICLLVPFRWQAVAESGYLVERQAYWDYLMLNPFNSLLEGGLVHLWFIPALVIAVAIIAFLVHIRMAQLLLPTAVLLYLYGVFAGSYITITELPTPFFTRNGPFFSTLLVVLGYLARAHQWKWSRNNTIRVILAGMALHFGEAYYLINYDIAFNSHDFLFWYCDLGTWRIHVAIGSSKFWQYALGLQMVTKYLGSLRESLIGDHHDDERRWYVWAKPARKRCIYLLSHHHRHPTACKGY